MNDLALMQQAIAQAEIALGLNEVPVGCVILHGPTQSIVGRGHNRRESNADPTAHAEIIALGQAARSLGTRRLGDCTMAITLEPCPMCAGAVVNARLGRLVYGCDDPKAGAVRTLYQICNDSRLNHQVEIAGGVMAEQCAQMLRDFFKTQRAMGEEMMKSLRRIGFWIFSALLAAGCATQPSAAIPAINATTQPSAMSPQDSPDWWRVPTAPLHGQQIVSGDSFTVIVPRSELDVESEMGQVPTSAGIASRFYFFRCPCGKVKLLGDFLACDYESDDVLDALCAGKFTIVSIAPILENVRPIMVSIRFQAEGEGDDLIHTLRAALDAVARHHAAGSPDE